MHLRPDLVKEDQPRDPEPFATMLMEDPDKYQVAIKHTQSEWEIPHVSQSDDVKIGVMGDPAGATAEMGRELFEECIEGLAEMIRKL